jgi:hypothetical protein
MPTEELTPSQAYLVVQDRLIADLTGGPKLPGGPHPPGGPHLPEGWAQTPVPCCPDWTARQTIAHLVGACADILAGRTENAGSPERASGPGSSVRASRRSPPDGQNWTPCGR